MATQFVDEGQSNKHANQVNPETHHPAVHTDHHVAPVIANPAPLGLMAFALTTFVLSCYNAGIWGVQTSSPANIVTGLALFYGGIAQGLAGMWEFKTGNTFGATAFTSYGAFWLSYAVILIPGFGVIDAYGAGHAKNIHPALGIFLLSWMIFTFLMWLGTLRTNVVLSALFFFLTVTFMLLAVGEFQDPKGLMITKAGGYFGILTACIAWYLGLTGLLTKENSFFTLPVGSLKRQ